MFLIALAVVLSIIVVLAIGFVASIGGVIVVNALNQAYHDRQAAKYSS